MLFSDSIKKFRDYLEHLDYSPSTIERYIRDLHKFNRWVEAQLNGQVYLEDVTDEYIENFITELKVEDYAPTSRSRYFYTFRSFYKFASKKGLVDRNIALTLEQGKLPVKERDYLTQEEITILIDAIDHRLIALVVKFLAYTGLRISECLNLKVDDIDFNNNFIRVREGKGRKDRSIPIHEDIQPLLKEYIDDWRDAYGSDYLFATKRTGSLSNNYVNAVIRKATKKLGWNKRISCHMLRHSFASNLVKKKVGLVEIQKLLGHSSLKTTSVYTHVDNEQLFDAVNSL